MGAGVQLVRTTSLSRPGTKETQSQVMTFESELSFLTSLIHSPQLAN